MGATPNHTSHMILLNISAYVVKYLIRVGKGQIISECPYEIIVSPIRPTKKFPRFLP